MRKKQGRAKMTRTRNSVHPSLKSIVQFSFGKKRQKKKAKKAHKKRSTNHKGPNHTHRYPTRSWIASVQKARAQMGVKGFLAVGGKTQKGQQLLKLARQIYSK